jgi:two-component system response regulator PilR (NtrC family)
MGKPVSGLAQESMELLEVYEWPGNIRELENVIERAVALEKSSAILPESLPDHILRRVPKGPAAAGSLPESGFDMEEHVKGLEREYIAQALHRAGGVQVKAAELLGMSFRSFRYYAKKYNLK